MSIKSISDEEKVDLKEMFADYIVIYDNDFIWDESVGKEIW